MFGKKMPLGLPVFLILALLPLAAWCDLIHTQGGRVYEGVIVEQNETTVTIQLSTGTVQLPREAVTKIEKQPTRQPTETPTETPQPTITRFPTSTPTDTPVPTATSTPVPTEAFHPLATPAPIYSATQADELIAKYEKVQIPKEKYVLAYYAKGVQAFDEKKPATAIMRWTDALRINQLLFEGAWAEGREPGAEPLMQVRFTQALEDLRALAAKDPNALTGGNSIALAARRDLETMASWIDRHFSLIVALAKYYEDKSGNQALAIENYLKAYRLLNGIRLDCVRRIEEATRAGDPFNLKRIFFAPRVESEGILVDARVAAIEHILEDRFGLRPDDYAYDYD